MRGCPVDEFIDFDLILVFNDGWEFSLNVFGG